VNERKEFFRVTIDEIADAVRGYNAAIQVTRPAAAVDYRKTLALLAAIPTEAAADDPATVAEQSPVPAPRPAVVAGASARPYAR
jgi:hypothetical protein